MIDTQIKTIESAVTSSQPLSADPAPFDEFSTRSHPSIAPEIADRVRRLLLKWPSGMPIFLLQGKFLDAYREVLPYLELGFNSVINMILSMPDYVILIPRVGKGEYILQGIPIRTEECVDQLLPPPGEYIPSKRDVVISYAKQAIPTNWEFKVYIPLISNPDRFWVQIVGPMTSSALKDHLEEITELYDRMNRENKLDYLLNNPVEGHNCAAPYRTDGHYYRAKILKFPFPDQADVYYVDYGKHSRVPLGSLRQLRHGHMVLPAQAIACRLANVRPVDGVRWPAGSARRMKDLTNNLELFCKVQNVEPDETLSVHLYHSNSPSGVSINQALISCGIACYEDTANSSAFMGTFEKVQKFLLTSSSPDDLETQRNSDCLRLEQLKSQQRSVVSKGVDLQDTTAYDLYLTQLRHLASEIDEIESKLSDSSPSRSCKIYPLALPSPPRATQSQQGMPPLAALQLVGRGRVLQVGETSGVRPHSTYKGIGRGGKVSKLV